MGSLRLAIVCVTLSLSGCTREEAPSKAPPPPAGESSFEIVPGVGVGIITFGMTKEAIIKHLGEPTTIDPTGRSLEYSPHGISFLVGSVRGLTFINCSTGFSSANKMKDFPGRTKEGIGMGATESQILDAYGKPSSRKMNEKQLNLRYDALPLEFVLFDNKVVQIFLQPRAKTRS